MFARCKRKMNRHILWPGESINYNKKVQVKEHKELPADY